VIVGLALQQPLQDVISEIECPTREVINRPYGQTSMQGFLMPHIKYCLDRIASFRADETTCETVGAFLQHGLGARDGGFGGDGGRPQLHHSEIDP
jgi:hypothetical protein